MMVLFRSTFVTATMTLLFALSLFSVTVTASPQFGRPLLHVLDAPATSATSTSDVPVPIQTVSVDAAVATPTISAASIPNNQSNGARSLQHASAGKFVLGAAAVIVYFVL